MPVERSLKAFKEERLNCAQSILRGFQKHFNISESRIAEFSDHGGGRVEDGKCGALFGALELAPDAHAKDSIAEAFLAEAKSLTCRDIRKSKSLSCAECVAVAAQALEAELVPDNH